MAYEADFNTFWSVYPRKISKLAAKKAYEKARKSGATQAQLLSGVTEYVKHKPGYADFAHPATWLNQGRWMDEWESGTPAPPTIDWFEECKRIHNGECGLNRWKHHERKQIEEMKRASV